jgi:hypothetical protein
VSGITEIREAIQKLPGKEAWQLAEELRDHLDALWDEQFEKDVEGGRFDRMIARAREEHDSGKTRSIFILPVSAFGRSRRRRLRQVWLRIEWQRAVWYIFARCQTSDHLAHRKVFALPGYQRSARKCFAGRVGRKWIAAWFDTWPGGSNCAWHQVTSINQ